MRPSVPNADKDLLNRVEKQERVHFGQACMKQHTPLQKQKFVLLSTAKFVWGEIYYLVLATVCLILSPACSQHILTSGGRGQALS